ncbi:MAG: hypothetical protein IAF02_27370 [Anaerolineae bacterium]|nr:hypothetical protein [Anaerolineae bacterium]
MKRGVWVFLFVLFVYILSYAGIQHSIDELATLALSDSILHGTLDVNRMEWEQERYPPQNAYGLDGDLYSKKGVAAVIATLPVLLVGKYWSAVGAVQLVFLTFAVVTAVTVFIFYLLVGTLGYSERTATLAALILGLGTLLWPYAQMLFSEPLAALGIALSLWSLALFWQNPKERWLLLCAGGGALLILSRSANVTLVLPFALVIAYRIAVNWLQHRNGRTLLKNLLAYGLPLAITVIALVAYNYIRFGTYLSHPTVAVEAFTTPLWTGIAGQLWSSGKGLIFYVPLTLMVFLSYLVDFRKMRSPIYLTALAVMLMPILFYSTWYDWPGGKAWGPRFLVPVMPALVLLCLPALNWLSQPRPKWRRGVLVAWLSLSVLAQLPGVLVNFDYQEILDGKAGMTNQDLLWHWSYAPLLTYWRHIFSGSANPVWFHAFFWHNEIWLLAFIGALVLAIVGLHIGLTRMNRTQRHMNLGLAVLAVLTVLLGLSMVVASREDVRWHDRTETIETNRAVRAYIQESASDSDLVLLELREGYDLAGRAWEWLNEAALTPDYLAYKRKPEIDSAEAVRLHRWLEPHGRVWLVMQATSYGDQDVSKVD